MDKKDKPVIIKRIIRREEGGAHGGSWKVAYADFVTAMMAFFLLMWLISMTAPGKKEAIANYFKFFNVFDQNFDSVLDKGYGLEENRKRSYQRMNEQDADPAMSNGEMLSVNKVLKEKLKNEVEASLLSYEQNVQVEITREGVRIEIMDNEGNPIFPLGSSVLNANGQKILSTVSQSLREIPNNIAIEGHTDALSYSTDKYTNWELSTERASAARRELQRNGIDPDRVIMVSGYAATLPLVRNKPNDPRNRRISINIMYL